MTNDCKTCPVSTGTHTPAEVVHQIDEPQADALRLAAWLLHRGMSGIKQNDIEASNQLRWLHAESLQHKQELAAYRFTVENREARIAELEDDLQFVERWAVHHGSKPSISAQEALSCIQHYPAIYEITKSYKDGKRPDTFNPYARIAELESQLEAIGAGGVEPLRKQAAQAVQAAVPDGWQMAPAKPTEAMVGAIMSEGEVDAVAGLAPELRPILLERAGIAARYTAMLSAAPAHPAEGVPAPAVPLTEDQRHRSAFRKMQAGSAAQARKDGIDAGDALYELAVKHGAGKAEAAGFAHHINGAFVLLEGQVHDGLRRESAMDSATQPAAQGMEKDAARYRWLRATTNTVTNSDGGRIDVRNQPDSWDAAIDAALAAQAKQGGAA